MNRRHLSFLLAGVVLGSALPGCRCPRGCRTAYVGPPWKGDTCDQCQTAGPQPPRFVPNGPPAVPAPAPPGVVAPPPGSAIQQNAFFPPVPPAGASAGLLGAPEPVEPQPARPLPRGSSSPPDTVRLSPPQTPEPPPASSGSAANESRSTSPAMPVDIPHFAMVKTKVAAGQTPFPEGMSWLKSHGYRTVLHIRAPGEDDRETRRQFEQSGLTYRSLEVSPETLSKQIVDEFNRLVTDANNLPLFVYDKDSALAGPLWYLHFRIVDKKDDEKARADAAQLGFKDKPDGQQLKMWIAVQKYLENNKP